MKRKHNVLMLAILLIMIIAICLFVGRDKPKEIVSPKGETEQKEQVDNNDDDDGIMEDQVFEEDDLTEENKESEENDLSKIPSNSGDKDQTQDVQEGYGEEDSGGDSKTEQPENDSVELPRVPLN